jgi:hypothetical protein
MAIGINGVLRVCWAGLALGGLIASVPAARAQWLPPPWRFAPPPGAIEQRLEAQGYILTAPLTWRPGVYLADVSSGPAGHQRLVVDARTGVILERFVAPGRMWGPTLAARDEGYGEVAPPGVAEPGPRGEYPGAPRPAPPAKSADRGPGNVHIPAAISPYDSGVAPAGTKRRPTSVSTERKAPATKPMSNPPLPPPAPREAAKPNGSAPAPTAPENHDTGQPTIDSHPTEVDNVPPASAPAGSAEANDKPKVSVVPPALFQ